MVSSFFCALGKRQTFTKSHRKANFGKGIRRLQTVLFRAGSGSKTKGHPAQICDISLRHGSKQRFDTRVDWQYQGHPDASVEWVGQFPGESRPDDPQARAQCCQNHMETAASRRKAAARRAVPGKNRPIFPLAGWIPAANRPDKHYGVGQIQYIAAAIAANRAAAQRNAAQISPWSGQNAREMPENALKMG